DHDRVAAGLLEPDARETLVLGALDDAALAAVGHERAHLIERVRGLAGLDPQALEVDARTHDARLEHRILRGRLGEAARQLGELHAVRAGRREPARRIDRRRLHRREPARIGAPERARAAGRRLVAEARVDERDAHAAEGLALALPRFRAHGEAQ